MADLVINSPPETTAKVYISVEITRLVIFRYWIAMHLIYLAGWVINSNIEFVDMELGD